MDRRQCRTGAAGRRWPRPRSSHWARRCFDARLSRKGRYPCASCHAPERAFTDGRPLAVGETGSWDGGAPRRCTPRPSRPALLGRTRRHAQGTSDGAAARSARDEPRRGRRGRPARRIRVPSRPVPARIWRSARTGFASRRRPHVVRAKPATRCHLRGARAGLSDRCRPAGARAAAYVATLRPERTRFDDFIEGRADALDDTELLGLHLFRTRPLHELPRRPAAERSRLPQHRAVFLRPAQPGSGAL